MATSTSSEKSRRCSRYLTEIFLLTVIVSRGGGSRGTSTAERFDVIVDRDGDDACLARNVSADHQYHAEFAERVGETEHRCRQEPRHGKRYGDRKERVDLRGAEGSRGLDLLRAEGIERTLQRLHGERQAVEARGDDQAGKGKRQRLAGYLDPPAADCAVGPEHDQQVKAHDGRRQDDGQGHDGLYGGLQA
jgi:hypothetical protein